MRLHPNYIKALEDHYKDFSYSETIKMIKKNRLYVAANSKYTIQSLPKDRVWAEDINTDTFKDSEDANDFIELLTDEELHSYGSHTGDSEYGMWVSSKKAELIKDNWDNEEWWEDYSNNNELKDIEDEFNKSKGEEFSGIIYNHLIDFTSLTDNEGSGKLITDSLKDKSGFEEQLRNKEIVINEYYEGSQYGNASSDLRIYYFDLSFKEKQHLEIITFIKDYEGNGLGLDDGTLELEGHFDGKYLMKNTLTRDVKFLNPINGKWENFLLEYDNDSGYRDSINYNYTHHLSDDNFDFSKDFPEEDKLNKALKLHLENIKKYGKE